MKYLILILTVVLLTVCGSNNSKSPEKTKQSKIEESNIPADVKYEIVKEETNEGSSRCKIDIKLNKMVAENVLKEISMELHRDRKQYDRLWISYSIPQTETSEFTWATANFTPSLEVEIFGLTEEKEKVLANVTVDASKIIGKWRDNTPSAESSMVIYKENGKLKLKTTYYDGSSWIEEMVQKQSNNKTHYYYVDDSRGEYFVVEKNGNLGMYSSDGKFGEAIKPE